MLNYIVNVHNCIKMSHYRLVFLEAMSKGQVEVIEISDISQLDIACNRFISTLNRLSISSSECRFIVCVPRTLDNTSVASETELYYRIMMKKLAADMLYSQGIDCEMGIILIDYYKDKLLYDSLRKDDEEVSVTGHSCNSSTLPDFSILEIGDYQSFISNPSEQINRVVGRLESPCGRDFFSEAMYSAVDYLRDSDGLDLSSFEEACGHFTESYADNFKRFIGQEHFWRFDVFYCPINYSNQTDERKVLLAIADYLIDCGEAAYYGNAEFSQKKLDEWIAKKSRIADEYGAALCEIKTRFDDYEFSKNSPAEFAPMDVVADSTLVTRTEDKLKACMEACSSNIAKKKFINILDGWPELFNHIRTSILCAPDIVERYAKEEVERFSEANSCKMELTTDICTNIAEDTVAREALADSLSPQIEDEEDGFAKQLEIDSKLRKTNHVLSYLCTCSKFVSVRLFIKTASFFVAVYIVLYAVQQHKLIFANTAGTVTFFVTIGIVIAVMLFSYVILNLWYRLRVMRLYMNLTKLIQGYFGQYIVRVKSFSQRLFNMRRLESMQRAKDSQQQENDNANDYGRRISWHKRQITEYVDDALLYFSSIMKSKKKAKSRRVQIDVYQDDVRNEFYWLSINRKDLGND